MLFVWVVHNVTVFRVMLFSYIAGLFEEMLVVRRCGLQDLLNPSEVFRVRRPSKDSTQGEPHGSGVGFYGPNVCPWVHGLRLMRPRPWCQSLHTTVLKMSGQHRLRESEFAGLHQGTESSLPDG